MYFFSYLESVGCSMSSSNCCFLTCIQISQEAGQVVWYSHFFQNFPQFVVIHTVKGFGIVNKAEINVFLELSCFVNDPADIGNLISGSFAFSKTSLNIPGCLALDEWSHHHDWLSGSWRSFLYSSSLYSCHLFLISSSTVRSIPFLSFIVPIMHEMFPWYL